MTTEQLEQRLAAVERGLASVEQMLAGGPNPRSRWWERVSALGPAEAAEADADAPYRAYIRRTGQVPPPGWRPGDPVPEPDHWQ